MKDSTMRWIGEVGDRLLTGVPVTGAERLALNPRIKTSMNGSWPEPGMRVKGKRPRFFRRIAERINRKMEEVSVKEMYARGGDW